jgi:hypothetical protein
MKEPSGDARRQLEGIAKAKSTGVYKDRSASIDAAQVRGMKSASASRRRVRSRLARSLLDYSTAVNTALAPNRFKDFWRERTG